MARWILIHPCIYELRTPTSKNLKISWCGQLYNIDLPKQNRWLDTLQICHFFSSYCKGILPQYWSRVRHWHNTYAIMHAPHLTIGDQIIATMTAEQACMRLNKQPCTTLSLHKYPYPSTCCSGAPTTDEKRRNHRKRISYGLCCDKILSSSVVGGCVLLIVVASSKHVS